MIAFSSVGHMGFVMLGIATLTDRGINGAIFGMVAHGLITGMLFFLAGSIHERYHTREISALGGMLQQMPSFGSLLHLRGHRIARIARPGRVLGRDAGAARCLQAPPGANETFCSAFSWSAAASARC